MQTQVESTLAPFDTGRQADSARMVTIQGHQYLVDRGAPGAPDVHRVGKDRRCSCGDTGCPAIDVVRRYLQAGGERAPGPDGLPACPICGGSVCRDRVWDGRYTGEPGWRCTRGGLRHFLQDKLRRIQQNCREHPWAIPPAPGYPGVRRDAIATWQECQAHNRRIFEESGYDPTR